MHQTEVFGARILFLFFHGLFQAWAGIERLVLGLYEDLCAENWSEVFQVVWLDSDTMICSRNLLQKTALLLGSLTVCS